MVLYEQRSCGSTGLMRHGDSRGQVSPHVGPSEIYLSMLCLKHLKTTHGNGKTRNLLQNASIPEIWSLCNSAQYPYKLQYKSSGNSLAASNMKQGQTSWNLLITSKDSSLEEIGSNDKSICRGWLAIMPCKDVGKAADSADLPKPTDTETLVVFFCKEKVCPVVHPALKSSFVANVKRGEALLWAITALRTLRSAHGIVLSHSRIQSDMETKLQIFYLPAFLIIIL